MSYLQYREQIRQAATLIKAGDMQAAREILHPLCDSGSADAWWLLAQTTQNPKHIHHALEKAITINPQHERALQQFALLFPDEVDDKPLDVELPVERKPKEKEKHSPAHAHSVRMLVVILGGLVIGLSIVVLFYSLTYRLPPPVLGPYYQRYQYIYSKQVPAPCSKFLVFGQVKKGSGMVAHLWIRDYDQQVTIDPQGSFQMTLPKEEIVYQRVANRHDLGDVPVKFQLLDNSGKEQSGINNLLFYGGCALYLEYWHDTSDGLKVGSPDLRPPSWNGPYTVAYSQLTTTPLLICEFTGFTGTAYDDNGPMRDIGIEFVNMDDHGAKPTYYPTESNGLEIQMGPSWWYVKLDPGHRYMILLLNPQGTIFLRDIIYLPKKQGCEANLIKVSIMQADARGGSPPALPTGWGNT